MKPVHSSGLRQLHQRFPVQIKGRGPKVQDVGRIVTRVRALSLIWRKLPAVARMGAFSSLPTVTGMGLHRIVAWRRGRGGRRLGREDQREAQKALLEERGWRGGEGGKDERRRAEEERRRGEEEGRAGQGRGGGRGGSGEEEEQERKRGPDVMYAIRFHESCFESSKRFKASTAAAAACPAVAVGFSCFKLWLKNLQFVGQTL